MDVSRRGLVGMLAAGVSAAIIRTPGILMPVKSQLGLPRPTLTLYEFADRILEPAVRAWVAHQRYLDKTLFFGSHDYAGAPVPMFRSIPIRFSEKIIEVRT